MIWKVIRTAKRFTVRIEKIQLVEHEDRYTIMYDRVVDGFYQDLKLLSSHPTKDEAHKRFNSYLNNGYEEIWEDE